MCYNLLVYRFSLILINTFFHNNKRLKVHYRYSLKQIQLKDLKSIFLDLPLKIIKEIHGLSVRIYISLPLQSEIQYTLNTLFHSNAQNSGKTIFNVAIQTALQRRTTNIINSVRQKRN